MNLKDYFNIEISNNKLYKLSEPVEGTHGLEAIKGKYFASQFQIFHGIGKNTLLTSLQDVKNKNQFFYDDAIDSNAPINQ